METWVRRDTVYEGQVVALEVGEVRLDDGTTALREVVRHPGGVTIVPVLDGSIVFVRQFRIALDEEILELPAGKIEGDETPLDRARSELEQETGYQAGRLAPLGIAYASVGYTSEKIHLFLAQDLVKTQQHLDEDERIEIVPLSFDEVRRRLADNTIRDAKTIVGIEMAWARMENA